MIALRLSFALIVVILIVSGCQTSQTQLEPELADWTNHRMGYVPMSRHDVHTINLAHSDVTDQELVVLSQFCNLRNLNLSDTKLTDAGLEHVKNAKGLWSLDLAHTRVTDAGVAMLGSLSTLDYIDLSGTAVSGKVIADLQSQNKDLYVHRVN